MESNGFSANSCNGEASTSLVVPIKDIIDHLKLVKDDIQPDESGLVAMSKSIEYFIRYIIQHGSFNGDPNSEYDSIARTIAWLNSGVLREFFPSRTPFAEVINRIGEDEEHNEQFDIDHHQQHNM
ncbi:unnamed protein product [Caenorhabditis bovis]|uniref:Uncharacterized protein n=1 Tax=Caenorhabditis bovis TaxID=2654633 RepID=A0A8S1EXM1_9PELO|nr:unnamed protein product [Caenorhabditis bovis]